MNHHHQHKPLTRREFFNKTSLGLGVMSFSSLLNPIGLWATTKQHILKSTHLVPRAKRIIYLSMAGAPSQLDLFDYKPLLVKMHGQNLPDSVLGDRLTASGATQATLPIVGTIYNFKQRGQSGMWMSDLLPYMSKIADELCMIKSMYTESVQHAPGQLFTQTGAEQVGRPSFGSWISYGLGSENENLPSFIVLTTKGRGGSFPGLYSSAFLPAEHQGVLFRSGKDPVLYLTNPPGIDKSIRKEQLEYLQQLQSENYDIWHDPTIQAKMAQYEMAFRMQTSVPEVVNTDDEPEYIYKLYGDDSKEPGTYASNCLLARRLAERGVRFIQLYHGNWDHHENLPKLLPSMCKDIDQATAALIIDLKQRGMLDDTLIIWGGEFGRTSFSQGELTADNFGRDHHPNAFTMLLAGAGVRKGITFGETDDFGYEVTEKPVHVHDLNATLLYLMGIEHEELNYKYNGRRFRLTDVHGTVVKDLLV